MLLVGKRISTRPVHVCKVYLIDEENMDIQLLLPSRSVGVHRFADDFSWGYSGEGPFQLSLSLLLEITDDKKLSLELCLSLTEDLIAELQTNCWVIDADDLQNWITDKIAEETS